MKIKIFTEIQESGYLNMKHIEKEINDFLSHIKSFYSLEHTISKDHECTIHYFIILYKTKGDE